MILVSVVSPSLLPFLLTTGLSTQTANEKLLCISRIFSEKQYTVMWQVLWLSPSPEQARPFVEASERKLRDVGFFGTSSNSREEIEKFQRE